MERYVSPSLRLYFHVAIGKKIGVRTEVVVMFSFSNLLSKLNKFYW
ncbi:hypothetical protein LINPERHAP1_LOCUS15938 [Linum perenne]